MRLTQDERSLIGKAVDRVLNISLVAKVLGVTRNTVYKWKKRRKQLKDKKRNAKTSKITLEVELAILAMRTAFRWGTARIQQGLICLPDYAKKALQNTVENVKLSRATINNVLAKHNLNGYNNAIKFWKFFRASKPDELWQLDLKGPFILQGRKYWFVICIDDYSRYLLLAEQFDHCPSTREITSLLDKLARKPSKLLTDNARHFAEQWKSWCRDNSIEPIFAHAYYPQDKGKVERAIRNVTEEFIDLLRKFPEWINGKIKDYQAWFNEKRLHHGIGTVPMALYT